VWERFAERASVALGEDEWPDEHGWPVDEGDGAVGDAHHHEWLETFDGPGADRYEAHSRWLRGMHRRAADRVAALTPPGARVLDVGCGPGRLLAELAARRPDTALTGVDVSERMVEIATARLARVAPGAGVLVGDVAALPLPDASADVVTAVLTAHHWEDVRRGVAEMARVLAPGGRVVVVELLEARGRVTAAMRATFGEGAVEAGRAWVLGLPLLARLEAGPDRTAD